MKNNWKIAVLSSYKSWFVKDGFTFRLIDKLEAEIETVGGFYDHEDITGYWDIVFIISYFKLVPKSFLNAHKHNLIVHESDLPKGKGWAPLFWQILKGKKTIPICLFEATEEVDTGKIYLKDCITLEGHELNKEIRKKQAEKTIDLCLRFLEDYEKLEPKEQKGKESFYKKRNPMDSELDIDNTIRNQFNLLRIVNNNEFPVFFYMSGHKYILKIYKKEDGKFE